LDVIRVLERKEDTVIDFLSEGRTESKKGM
jgi:hypothetical protein